MGEHETWKVVASIVTTLVLFIVPIYINYFAIVVGFVKDCISKKRATSNKNFAHDEGLVLTLTLSLSFGRILEAAEYNGWWYASPSVQSSDYYTTQPCIVRTRGNGAWEVIRLTGLSRFKIQMPISIYGVNNLLLCVSSLGEIITILEIDENDNVSQVVEYKQFQMGEYACHSYDNENLYIVSRDAIGKYNFATKTYNYEDVRWNNLQEVIPDGNNICVVHNGRIYIVVDGGVISLSTNGSTSNILHPEGEKFKPKNIFTFADSIFVLGVLGDTLQLYRLCGDVFEFCTTIVNKQYISSIFKIRIITTPSSLFLVICDVFNFEVNLCVSADAVLFTHLQTLYTPTIITMSNRSMGFPVWISGKQQHDGEFMRMGVKENQDTVSNESMYWGLTEYNEPASDNYVVLYNSGKWLKINYYK